MFTEGAIIRYLYSQDYSKHRDKLILRDDFEYKPATKNFTNETIPKGFITDNASVPDWVGYATAAISGIISLILFLLISLVGGPMIGGFLAVAFVPIIFFSIYIHPNDKRLREAAWHHDFVPQTKGYYMEKYGYTDKELFFKSNQEYVQNARKHGFPKLKCIIMLYAINTSIARNVWNRGGQLKE